MSRPMPRVTAALASALAFALPLTAGAQDDRSRRDAFTWEDDVPAGRWVHVRNVNGDVRVERASGGRVSVTATKRWRRGNPSRVRVVQQAASDGRGVVICALYDRGDGGRCDEREYRSGKGGDWWNGRNDDVSVDFVVRVPPGVRVDLATTNGSVDVRGAGSEVVAHTTNGNVRAESEGGPVVARTTNGNVTARMAALGDARDLDFATTNGSVVVEMPDDLGAEVSMSTTNGSVSTEFPATVQGRLSPRRLTLTLGDGSRRVRMHTTNGNVELRRGRGR